MSAREVDPYDVVEQHWPYDGPYSPEQTAAAATVVGRLGRYLNNATQKRDALPYANVAHNVLSGVGAAVFGLDQLVEQLAAFAERQADDSTLYDDRYDRSPAMTALDLAAELAEMRPAIGELARRLQAASAIASHLGNNDPIGGDES
jgi:uncharacterized protein (DUF885 family)